MKNGMKWLWVGGREYGRQLGTDRMGGLKGAVQGCNTRSTLVNGGSTSLGSSFRLARRDCTEKLGFGRKGELFLSTFGFFFLSPPPRCVVQCVFLSPALFLFVFLVSCSFFRFHVFSFIFRPSFL